MPRAPKATANQTPPEPAAETFESLFAALEEHARRLEERNLGLEESLRIAEEAAETSAKLRAILDAAESRVTNLRARFEDDAAPPDVFMSEEEVDYDYGDEGPPA